MPSLSDLKDYATIAGVLIGATSLAFAAFNTWLTSRASRARFWLDLRQRFATHSGVHQKLRPGGDWFDRAGPSNAAEWSAVESYMGLFEHCEIMLDQRLIDGKTFSEIYRYRVINLVANDTIRTAKLIENAAGWSRFLALAKRLKIDINPPQGSA